MVSATSSFSFVEHKLPFPSSSANSGKKGRSPAPPPCLWMSLSRLETRPRGTQAFIWTAGRLYFRTLSRAHLRKQQACAVKAAGRANKVSGPTNLNVFLRDTFLKKQGGSLITLKTLGRVLNQDFDYVTFNKFEPWQMSLPIQILQFQLDRCSSSRNKE